MNVDELANNITDEAHGRGRSMIGHWFTQLRIRIAAALFRRLVPPQSVEPDCKTPETVDIPMRLDPEWCIKTVMSCARSWPYGSKTIEFRRRLARDLDHALARVDALTRNMEAAKKDAAMFAVRLARAGGRPPITPALSKRDAAAANGGDRWRIFDLWHGRLVPREAIRRLTKRSSQAEEEA